MTPSLSWFNEARYGMFIHWGAYAVGARGEWVRNRERIPQHEYEEKYVRNWKAERYDPQQWVALAQDAGMKYLVLTTRHHDGFCLWDTDTTPYHAAAMGPGRDLVRPFVEAVRAAGLKVGFYYSVADWHHPDYPDAYARDWPTEWPDEDKRQRFVQFYRAQLEELMTRYGPIDLLWHDGCLPKPTGGEEVNTFLKTLQPHLLINNRNGQPSDFHCSEQAIRPAAPGVPWEACLTLNDNWGYHAGDTHHKSAKQVIMMLTETAAGGGNLLLNVGPKADGTIPEGSESILRQAGAWLRTNKAFLANSSRSPFGWNNWGRITTKCNRVYLHIFHSPGAELCVSEIKNRVLSARLLGTGQSLPFEQTGDRLFIRALPPMRAEDLVTTLVLEVEGKPEAVRPQTIFWIPGQDD